MTYTISEHKHRLAFWAAATAARSRNQPFKVSVGKALIETARLKEWICAGSFDRALTSGEFDLQHRKWRCGIVKAAESQFSCPNFSHGTASKLINMYLKVWLPCSLWPEDLAEPQSDRANLAHVIHPLIDRTLLQRLLAEAPIRREVAQELRGLTERGWSNLNSPDYERVIELLRGLSGDDPFWMIERYWTGHQGEDPQRAETLHDA